MRIVFLISHFPPEWIGGAEIQISRLAEKLSERGYRILVLTRRWVSSLHYQENRKGYTIRRFRVLRPPVLRFLSHIIFSLNEIRKIQKDIDILQCIMLTPNGLVGVIAKKLWGVKTVAWIRGGDWFFAKKKFSRRLIIKFVLKHSDLILVQTPRIKKEVLNWCPNIKVEVVPNGIDIPNEKADGDKIIFVGNLIWRKGVKYLIEAMKNVKASLIIVGDGEKKTELIELSKGMNNIEFVGRVHPAEVREYLKQGKIFVLPAIAGEGQPNVILEAMAMGLPVVATNLAGIPDTVEHGKTGFIVNSRDPQKLANCINLLLKDEELWEKMRNRCLEEVKKYSWERTVRRLESIYERVIKE
jgi:glycosyltransferase involved in cell wall biosynthesis